LEQNWELRKRIQQDKIDEDLRRQTLLEEEKRKRIEERELILRKQLEKQQGTCAEWQDSTVDCIVLFNFNAIPWIGSRLCYHAIYS
jgi:DNA-directed RNA polymerase delta subunit